MEHKINEHFRELTRGLMYNDSSAIYSGYSSLYQIGPSALPMLEDAVLKCDVADTKFKELSRYVSGLVSLIHDIDEDESKELIGKITSTPCSDHIRQILHSITQFSKKDFEIYKIEGIEVIEDKGIEKNVKLCPTSGNPKKPEGDVLGNPKGTLLKNQNSLEWPLPSAHTISRIPGTPYIIYPPFSDQATAATKYTLRFPPWPTFNPLASGPMNTWERRRGVVMLLNKGKLMVSG